MTPRQHTDRIISRIASVHGLTLAQVIEQDKRHSTAGPRHQVWLDVCLELGWTTTQVGRRLNRDHTTIVYGRQRAASVRFGLPEKARWPEIKRAAFLSSGELPGEQRRAA